jgi:hypothetical protein
LQYVHIQLKAIFTLAIQNLKKKLDLNYENNRFLIIKNPVEINVTLPHKFKTLSKSIIMEFLDQLHAYISAPWPWWMGGIIIAITLFLLLFFGKEFGLSANLRTMCAADGAGDFSDFFNFDWQSQGWNLMVALGALFGGYIAATYFSPGHVAHISEAAVATLNEIAGGIPEAQLTYGNVPIVPAPTMENPDVPIFWDLYSWESLFSLRGLIIIVGGGFLIGFGSRYAGGCTSGHAISGIADLQLPSLVAVVFFFIGGLIMTYFFLPYILQIPI